jgi:arylsulfatase A-like enzyme
VHHADFIRTIADIFGATLPDNSGEDSVSLLPLLKGDHRPVRETAVSTSVNGVPALRNGEWKYIPAQGSGGWSKTNEGTQFVQLYDLDKDIGESKNLADAMPDKVAEMQALLEKLITEGRSTPGPRASNDVEVVRYPKTRGKPQTDAR